MKYLRWLLLPFSLLYGLVVIIRNWFYDAGIFKSYKADVPVISIGNLDVGGAGKSPMAEYLVRLFKNDYNLATLSRGYGRETKGYYTATHQPPLDTHHSPRTAYAILGDEPAQFAQKFPDITVAVCEDRVAGIKRLQPTHNLIILDDAYQHRAVVPGLSILLFEYGRVFEPRFLLPAGNLREPFSGYSRADVIVITKCPEDLGPVERSRVIARVSPLSRQQIFFTSIAYQPLQSIEGKNVNVTIGAGTTVFLLTGIANPAPLLQHIRQYTSQIIHHKYADHHRFSLKNITKLANDFKASAAENKIIITTEKDAQRLVGQELLPVVQQLPILVLPIGINFLNDTQQQFNSLLINYVRGYTKHS